MDCDTAIKINYCNKLSAVIYMTLKNIWSQKRQHKNHIEYDFKSIMSQNRKSETMSFTDANIDIIIIQKLFNNKKLVNGYHIKQNTCYREGGVWGCAGGWSHGGCLGY